MNTVLCLHASASNGGQWRSLKDALGDEYRLITPDLLGYGKDRFADKPRITLDNEVDNVLRQVGDWQGPIHVVGHSYGGGVALQLAKRYPDRVKSLTLYEPAHILTLFEDGLDTDEAREACELRNRFGQHAESKWFSWLAARRFVNYWSGAKAWDSLRFRQRRRIARLAPKVAAEFDALFSANASLGDASQLTMPVNLLCGTDTQPPAKRVCELLRQRLKYAKLTQVEGAQHMAPLTHSHIINPLIMDCLRANGLSGNWLGAAA